MSALSRITFCGAFLTALLGSALAKNTQTDFDHQSDFSQYKTFSWQAIKTADPLWGARIKNAVNAQLAAKGSTQPDNGPKFPFPPAPPPFVGQQEPALSCPSSAPCVVIVAIQTTETQRSLQGFYSGFGGGWGWQGFRDGDINITEQNYKEGTLVVDMYDAKTKQLIWRGSAEGTLSDKAEKNEKKLNTAVAKVFKDFPPRSTQS